MRGTDFADIFYKKKEKKYLFECKFNPFSIKYRNKQRKKVSKKDFWEDLKLEIRKRVDFSFWTQINFSLGF